MKIRVAVLLVVGLVPACKGNLNQSHGDAAAEVGLDGPLPKDGGAIDSGMTADGRAGDAIVPDDGGAADIAGSPDTDNAPEGGIAPKSELGLSCAAGGECASGSCVDGVCCESACDGSCEACGEPDTKGQCIAVMGTPRPKHPACEGAGTPCVGTCDGASRAVCTYPGTTQSCREAGCTAGMATLAAACDGKGTCPKAETVDCAPNACSGTICAGGCSATSPCTGSTYCAAGKCVAKKASGQTCTAASDCTSGFCADGYCCNSACATACTACNLTALLGVCSPVKAGIDDMCSGMSSCDATGTCKKATGQTCTGAADCTSGNCVDGHCCGTASCGACQACTGGGGTCVAVNNAEDADSCSGTKSCDATAMCKPKAGQACTAASQCGSGFCADGVCCNAACTGACESCGEASSKGTCTAVTGAPRSGHPACAGGGTMCGGSCDGTNRTTCTSPGASTSCRSASCTAGVATLAASCDGKGACPGAQTVNCAPNTCSGAACAGGCSASQPCAGNNYCSGGVCMPKAGNGSPCTDSAQCSVACVDNVCCGSASCGSCQACGAGGTCVAIKNADDANSCTGVSTCDASGMCKKKQGQACSVGGDCANGACVDGVCCDSACGGQCQACNEPGKAGTCTRVTSGVPRGTRTPCKSTDANCAGHCDGSSDTQCGYPGSGTSCALASCSPDMSMASGPTNCNGLGACTTAATSNCGSMTKYCSTGSCVDKVKDGGPCQTNIQCVNGTCANGACCGSGQTACSGACFDLLKSSVHCGSCSAPACLTGQSCINGNCFCPQKSSWNLLPNSGFDNGSSPWVIAGPLAKWITTDINGCQGSGSIEVQNISDEISYTMTAQPNTTYYFGFRTRLASGETIGVGGIGCVIDFNSSFGLGAFVSPPDFNWTGGNESVTSPAGTTNLTFHCEAQGADVYYDQLYLTTDSNSAHHTY